MQGITIRKLNIKDWTDWYQIQKTDFLNNKGRKILSQYGGEPNHILIFLGSPSKCVMNAFPQYQWNPWQFKIAHDGIWNKMETQVQTFV